MLFSIGLSFSVDGDSMIVASSTAIVGGDDIFLEPAADYFERGADGVWVEKQTLTLLVNEPVRPPRNSGPVELFDSVSLDGDRVLPGLFWTESRIEWQHCAGSQ
ncbi:MAG: hypothetical protein V3U76_18920 [Granulosicoccus sp.]